jgi:hypothetical protein
MPRVLVMREDGQVFWSETVTASDFQGEHFCRCLADRLGWAVADAEMLSMSPNVSSTSPDVSALRAARGGHGASNRRQRSKIAV